MANININTTSNQYQNLLAGLNTLRNVLNPRIDFLAKLPHNKQKQWLQRDPLLRRTILLSRKLSNIFDGDLNE